MFSIVDILTVCIIAILFFFLFIVFLIEKSFAKPRIYLKTVISLILLLCIIQELIFLKIYEHAIWIFPLTIGGLFFVYPLIYLYSRDLVFSGKDTKRPQLLTVLILPLLIIVFISIIYYPLDYNSKIKFINSHILESTQGLKGYKLLQYLVIPVYYGQALFYLAASLKLISDVKKNISSNPWELLLVRYILIYVIAVFFYEVFLLINSISFIDNLKVLWAFEQLLSLLFLALCLYIGLKQSLIVIQSRMTKYSEKLGINNESKHINSFLLENEKKEIKEAIENYFNDTRVYLDSNLKLELLSKKIHITTRRISLVVNEVYGTNFNHFINEYRINEAKKLMALNPQEVKIENIYTKVGFNSRSAFNHAFKDSTGITPIDFIKNLASK